MIELIEDLESEWMPFQGKELLEFAFLARLYKFTRRTIALPQHQHLGHVWASRMLRLYVKLLDFGQGAVRCAILYTDFPQFLLPYFSAYKTEAFPFQNKPKNLDLSYKMDQDFWDCFGRAKLVL